LQRACRPRVPTAASKNGTGRTEGLTDPAIKLVNGAVTDGPDLSVVVNGMKLPNPFVIGSGPPGTNYQVMKKAFDEGWGGVICKTLSLDSSKVQSNSRDDLMLRPGLAAAVRKGCKNAKKAAAHPHAQLTPGVLTGWLYFWQQDSRYAMLSYAVCR
jgi:hypothetical protein